MLGNEFHHNLPAIGPLLPHADKHIHESLAIFDEALGRNYISRELLTYYMTHTDRCLAFIDQYQDSVRGILLGHIMSTEESLKYEHDIEQVLGTSTPLSHHRVGLLKSISVHRRFRKHGIGTRLSSHAMTMFKNFGCSALFAVSWRSNRPDNSQKMFENLGFDRIGEISDYWTEESIREGYECPNCGNPCKCAAIFYFKVV